MSLLSNIPPPPQSKKQGNSVLHNRGLLTLSGEALVILGKGTYAEWFFTMAAQRTTVIQVSHQVEYNLKETKFLLKTNAKKEIRTEDPQLTIGLYPLSIPLPAQLFSGAWEAEGVRTCQPKPFLLKVWSTHQQYWHHLVRESRANDSSPSVAEGRMERPLALRACVRINRL